MKRIVLSVGMTLTLALVFAASAIGTPSAQAQDTGSLVIYAYACPSGFEGGNEDACRSTPLAGEGITAFAAGQDNGIGATTDADGVASVSLSAIGGGTVNALVSPPSGYESVYVACSEDYGAIESGITFANLATDDFVTCQWYFVPTASGDPGGDPGAEDGWLSIQIFGCPDGFDGEDTGECEGTPLAGVGVSVAPAGQNNGVGGTTDGTGAVGSPLFAADLPGSIDVKAMPPAGYAGFSASCWDASGEAVDFSTRSTGVTLHDLEPGAEIGCALYALPAGDDADDDDDRNGVDRLPNTGAGINGQRSAGTTSGLLLLGVGITAVGLIAVGQRRRA